ncbi:hypothetical protein C8Q80DRAFT_428462 [Daedaleopsis nitida]|nr:hypothetical protein C8Q80DRAFT_428462 [Daedaleopsis nitida]
MPAASSPPPSTQTPPPPSSPSSMPIYLSNSNMPPIHMLPVELLTRVFQLGVDSEPLPDDRDNSQLTFEVSVSHVCRHWRHIALHTPHLWTLVHFRTKSHMNRGQLYLTRNARLPIDIYVDTCSEDTHKARKDLLFRDEFLPVFDIVLPNSTAGESSISRSPTSTAKASPARTRTRTRMLRRRRRRSATSIG